MAQLRAALDAAGAGRGSMVLLTGAAGIGKSRLVGELVAGAEGRGLSTALGRATLASAAAPFGPLTQALLQLLRGRPLPANDDFRQWRAVLAPIIPGLAPDAERGVQSAAVQAEAVVQLLGRLTREAGAVLVLEDLHWADPDTLQLLEYVADAVDAQPVVWMLTCRDVPGSAAAHLADRVRERRGVTHVPVPRLEFGEVAEMVRACRPGAPEELVARVQRSADGVPLFVEEILASPGVPASFDAAVRARLAELDDAGRQVLEAAAVLGRQVVWELLSEATGLPQERVWHALERGVACALLVRDGDVLRFRHALTREAVVEGIRPPDRRELARTLLQVLERAGPERDQAWQGLAAELALQAGDRLAAGRLLTRSGLAAFAAGALPTAVGSLRRAAALLDGQADTVPVRLDLVRALTAAGQIDEALAEGERLVAALGMADGQERGDDQLVAARLALAEAAAAAARWPLAERYLTAAGVPGPGGAAEVNFRVCVLAAEVAFAADRADDARALLTGPLTSEQFDPEVRCRAFELLGRMERLTDLGAARDAFEQALATAQAANLPVRSLHALHELGTIELFDHGGTRRLSQAREIAQRLGAMGTQAVLDLQLTAAALGRFAPDDAERHALAALAVSERLGLQAVTAKALSGLAEACAQRRQRAEMERYLALAAAADPDDPFTVAFSWGQCRGMLALLEDDWPAALSCLSRGIELLGGVGHPEPVEFRALWPLLLAHFADPRAAEELRQANGSGLNVAFANRGLLGYAQAILAGREGRRDEAAECALRADAYLARFPVWADLARLCAADAACTDRWGHPDRWLSSAAATFTGHGLGPLAERCRRQLSPVSTEFPGVTEREADVLRLLSQGLANKEIGARLHLSPRTVEKHVESLLRKTGSRSRTQLATYAARRGTT
jgi:DNA-binding CsgD family transcriptional regulator/tetratricopeptide (TPR) repeat protein